MQPNGRQPPVSSAAVHLPAAGVGASPPAAAPDMSAQVSPVAAGSSSSGNPGAAAAVPGLPLGNVTNLQAQQQQQKLPGSTAAAAQGMPPPPPRKGSEGGSSAGGGNAGPAAADEQVMSQLPKLNVVTPRDGAAAAAAAAAGGGGGSGMVAATPCSVFSFATADLSSDDSEQDNDEDGDNGNGFGKRRIKRTLTRLQRQQKIIAAQNAALAAHQLMAASGATPYGTPHGSPRTSVDAPDAADAAAAATASPGGGGAASAALPGGRSPPGGGYQTQTHPGGGCGSSGGGGFGGKDPSEVPGGVASLAALKGPQSAFAAAALAAAAAAKNAAVVKDPKRQQADLEAELAVLQELMGDSVQGADIYKRMPWFDKSEMKLYSVGFLACIIFFPLILAGLVAASNNVAVPQIYRVLLYFGGWPVIWLCVNVFVWCLMIQVERWYYKQALCYHGKLRRTLTFMIWTSLLLVWFHGCGWIIPCPDQKCRVALVHNAGKLSQTVWRFSLCAMLFSLALFVTALLGSILGRHFYNTAHFNKVASVLWKQYWLVRLSQPRSKLVAKDQLLADRKGGDDDDDSAHQQHLRHRKGAHKGDAEGGGSPKSKGWRVLKNRKANDQLLPTHTASGKALQGINSNTKSHAVEKGAAAALDAPYIASQDQGGPYSDWQHSNELLHRRSSGSGHRPVTLEAVAEGFEGSSFRSVSLSGGMGPNAADPSAQIYQSRRSHVMGKLLRRQAPYGDPNDPTAAAAGSSGSWFANWRSGWRSGSGQAPEEKLYDFGAEAEKALHMAGEVRAAMEDSDEVPNDPLLDAGVLRALNVKLDGKLLDARNFSAFEWPRIREGIAVQTYEVLQERYRGSKTEEDQQLKAARRLGKALFQHIKGEPGRAFLVRGDFDPFFAGLHNAEAEADAAFFFFDKENNAVITQHEMVNKVVQIVQERQDMASSLRDTNSIVSTLEFGIGLAINIMFMLMYLAVWKIDVAKGFTTVTAALMFFSFMFSNSAKNVFEATLFLLVAHAYDVGDMLDIEGTLYRVMKITLLYTTLSRNSGEISLYPNTSDPAPYSSPEFLTLIKNSGEISLYPNSKLLLSPLINLSRGNVLQTDKVVIHVDTGAAGNTACEALQAAMQDHFDENERNFNSVPVVRFTGIINPFKAELTIFWTYNFGPSETGRAKKVKSALLRVVQDTLGRLPEMLAGSAAREDSVAPLAPVAGDAGGNREQEMMMMNAAVMGQIAATDMNVNPDSGLTADSIFMA